MPIIDWVKLSIIIVNYNVKHFIEQCLHAVLNAGRNTSFEVFVVDNNSVDGSVQLIKDKFPTVKLIENKRNTGFSVANNQAIRLSRGEYVLLLNPDTVVQEDTFEKVIHFMDAHPEAGGLGVKMLDGKGNFLPESKRGLPTPAVAFYKIFGLTFLFPYSKKFGQYHLSYLDNDKIHEIDVLSGAFMFMRKSVLEKTGLLDEDYFMYGEDIDLSYRIKLAGYKNYYFPETRIIHYKGESTKKSSVNYVFVFYKAMIIFAQKHFSQRHAKLFSVLIHLAIYLRAGLAIAIRFVKKISLPLLDLALMILGLMLIKNYYEKHFIFREGGSYDTDLVTIAFSIYSIIWQLTVYLSGGYDKPIKLFRMIRGVAVGTGIILIAYSLLPESYRFSRALILFGALWVSMAYMLSRFAFHLLKLKGFRLFDNSSKRIAIIGNEEEFERVIDILKQTAIQTSYVGFVSLKEEETKNSYYAGSISQLHEVLEINSINEIIFCSRNISSQEIIHYMLTLVATDVDFKIAPPESLSIIGSNSIDTAGDLYVIDVNSINKPHNKRNKRFLDIGMSLVFLMFSPLLVWFQKKKFQFVKNVFQVLLGMKSWVGYGDGITEELPKIKQSVLSPADIHHQALLPEETRQRLNLNYSKNYQPENDFFILIKNLHQLGK